MLKRAYARGADDVAAAIEALTEIDVVVTDLPAVEAGLVFDHCPSSIEPPSGAPRRNAVRD